MSPASAVTVADRRYYREHGVVALRGVLDPATIDALAAPVSRAMAGDPSTADLSSLSDALAGAPGRDDTNRGRFRSGVDHWLTDGDMREFATNSVLPSLVAALLETTTLFLYEDSILVKEPNSAEPTVFHQDHPYFSVDGDLVCTTWIPLDSVTRETGGIGYVRGSHLDDTEWRPNLFVTRDPIPGTTGIDVPDFHTDPGDADVTWIDAEPGDVIVHHSRTLHGAGPNTSPTATRRAVSVRYCGDGVTFSRRAITPKPHHDDLPDGGPIGPPAFPQVHP